jgi:ubiquinone/menaquinone biosynthesis C-methylase UbiE
MDREIVAYYDQLASTYDADRFANSYGQFIDRRERQILETSLAPNANRILDIGCGTGRLTNYATHGCDASGQSLGLAADRHPSKAFAQADVVDLPYQTGDFDAAFCFHVYMHLDVQAIKSSFSEVSRILRPGGIYIADIASARRRRLTRHSSTGWHGATSLTRAEFADIGAQHRLRLTACRGVMLAPVHRLPTAARSAIGALDHQLAALVPDLASYLVGRFERI